MRQRGAVAVRGCGSSRRRYRLHPSSSTLSPPASRTFYIATHFAPPTPLHTTLIIPVGTGQHKISTKTKQLKRVSWNHNHKMKIYRTDRSQRQLRDDKCTYKLTHMQIIPIGVVKRDSIR